MIPGTYYGSAWAADNRTFFYVAPDDADAPPPAVAPRARHAGGRRRAGAPGGRRAVLPRRRPHQGRAVPRARTSAARSPTRCWHPRRRRPDRRRSASCSPREQDVEYGVEHHGDRFFILTNADGAENFKLDGGARRDARPRALDRGRPPPRRREARAAIDVFADHLVLFERRERRAAHPRHAACDDGARAHASSSPRRCRPRAGGANPEFDTDVAPLRLHVAGHAAVGVRLRPRHPRARRCSSSSRCSAATTPSATSPSGCGPPADDGDAGADLARVPRAIGPRRPGPALLYGYGSYEASHGPVVLVAPPVAARPRLRVRHRPHPRRRRDGPALVRRRQVPRTSATRSPTSSPAPSTSSPRAGPHPSAARRSGAGRPAAC